MKKSNISFEKFEGSKISNLRAVRGGKKDTVSTGGPHKGQGDAMEDNGSVVYDNGDTGQVIP